MSSPKELSFDEILKYMLAHNGKVTNYELVKHFKVFLTNPSMRDEARSTFKRHVNSLAIIKNHNNEKWLILKKKYMTNNGNEISDTSFDKQPDSSSTTAPETSIELENTTSEPVPERPPLPLHLNQDLTLLHSLIQRPPSPLPEPLDVEIKENLVPSFHANDDAPKAHPRRRSSGDKHSGNDKHSTPGSSTSRLSITSEDNIPKGNETLSPSKSELMLVDSEHKISVKERKQMFNRMASEGDILKPHSGTSFNSQGVDEEDRVSVISMDQKSENGPLDPKQKTWILCAARGEYHALAKMCSENSKLAKTKDPFTTAMHWACKKGDENLVKLLAGVARNIVNERSNGYLLLTQDPAIGGLVGNLDKGYTPLHIAMQFRHKNVYKLLVDVYDADPNMRDWSGRKPMQYFVHMDTSLSPGSYRKADSFDLRRSVRTPPSIRITQNATLPLHSKKEGFLRIGSLNVRVKKTTEAFSNFLGVGPARSPGYVHKSRVDSERRSADDVDHIHKTWGSADNIQKNDKLMPPPMSNKVRRRTATGRRGAGAHSHSTPSTPDQPRAHIGTNEEGESDSDSAAGFHSAWRQQRASDVM